MKNISFEKLVFFVLRNKWLIVIVFLGLFLRLYKIETIFNYGHDHDLASWIVKDVLVNKHPRLIGQQTSTLGIFIGPYWYYTLIPFYILFAMDPIAIAYQSAFIGAIAIISCYFVFGKLIEKQAGLIAALLYSISFFMINNDREGVPTTPVILWTIWGIYVIYLFLKGKEKKVFVFAGILTGLIWHLNFALVFYVPVWCMAYLMTKKDYAIRDYINGIIALIITSFPLLLFELRHGFIQVKSLLFSLWQDQGDTVYLGIEKYKRVIFLINKNFSNLFSGGLLGFNNEIALVLIIILFLYFLTRKILDKKLIFSFFVLFSLFVLFFSNYSKTVSEYYLNGITLLSFFGLVLLCNEIIKRSKRYGLVFLGFVFAINMWVYIQSPPSGNGYKYRKEVINAIKHDMIANNYSCSGISYLTDPGYDLGYRYFMWREDIHVAKISEDVPVYSIVYPLRDYFIVDNLFGSIGIIKPNRQDPATINCGDNINVTEPLFGYTQ